jgi:hypothetical protein
MKEQELIDDPDYIPGESPMCAIPEAKDNPDGLHHRYNVTHADGSPTDPMATYFVLRLDGMGRDGLHIAACRAAARAYAAFVLKSDAAHLRPVAHDLNILIDNLDGIVCRKS